MTKTTTKEKPEDPGSAIINPISVAEMVDAYNRAMSMVEDAHTRIANAYQTLNDAGEIMKAAFGDKQTFYVTEAKSSMSHIEAVRGVLLRACWRSILDMMDVWKVLSFKRAEELKKRLEEGDLPPINDEEIFLMYETMVQNKREYAEEFAMEVYEWLTPGNKQYSQWEAQYVTNKRNARDHLGEKVIIGWMIRYDWGSMSLHYDKGDKLSALDRIFYLLDGQKPPEVNSWYTPSRVAIDEACKAGHGKAETDYFRFQACKNGNLHIWFKRMDLVQKLNEIAGNPTALRQKKHKIQRGDHTVVDVPNSPETKAETYEEAFFWTPKLVIDRMLEVVPLPPASLMTGKKFLEPSAGEGHIVERLILGGVPVKSITCVEKNFGRVSTLFKKGYVVFDMNFLKFLKDGWDYIYMNPPFNQEQDMIHVMHAYKLLAPGGKLCAVMSEHDFTASKSSSARYFRDWLERVGGKNEKLPPGSFRKAGTSWDTRLVWICKKENQ